MALFRATAAGVATVLMLAACQPDLPDTPEFLDMDQDGIENALDPDTDGDGIDNINDDDDDNDGVADKDDDFPLDPSESVDTDHDGIGNNKDTDDDNDGVDDAKDVYPFNSGEWANHDGDALGDNFDPDDDNDGVEDLDDAFPFDASEQLDTDGDGIGNNADTDDDNDGEPDYTDSFPLNPAEQRNNDDDAIGNNEDTDDDNDGVPDTLDAFPLHRHESIDTDGDGIGNNSDDDDDNDGVKDIDDLEPLNASQSTAPSWQFTANAPWDVVNVYRHNQTVRQFEVEDVDQDGLLDITLLTDSELLVMVQQNDGNFEESLINTNGLLTEFRLGNLDEDGFLEVVTFSQATRKIERYDLSGDNASNYTWTGTDVRTFSSGNPVFAVVDTDDNGYAEIIAKQSSSAYFHERSSYQSNYGCGSADNSMHVATFLNSSLPKTLVTSNTGTVVRCSRYNQSNLVSTGPGFQPVELHVADLNGSGTPEMIMTGNHLAIYTALYGDPSQYAPSITLAEGQQVRHAAIADVNGDAIPEIAYSSDISGNLIVLQRTATSSEYQSKTLAVGLSSTANLMFKDWDKDGNIDLLVNSDANGLQAYIPSHLEHQMFTLSGETFRFQASAADADGNALQFELQSGYDAAFFTLNSETGLLASKAPLNGDTPLDENSDNQYELTITASDGTYAITRSIGIRVIP